MLIKPLPIENQRKLYDAYTARLNTAKETWLPTLLKGSSKLSNNDLELINNSVKSHYSFYEGLGLHPHVLPYINQYRP